MTAHRGYAVRRGTTWDGQPGWAARCHDCEAITFGGAPTRQAAIRNLDHDVEDKNAPETVAAVTEGESKSRCSGSQNDIQHPAKDTNVMTSIAPTTDNGNDWLTPEIKNELAAEFYHAGIYRQFERFMEKRDEARTARAERLTRHAKDVQIWEELAPKIPLEHREDVRNYINSHDDLDVESYCRRHIPTFPAPTSTPRGFGWAEEFTEPSWIPDDDVWSVCAKWSRDWPEGGGVTMDADIWTEKSGKRTIYGPRIYVNVDQIDNAQEAREIAAWLCEAADALDGPPSADHAAVHPRPMGLQRLVTKNIERLRQESGIGQNEFATIAGYGTDEFSTFMVGRRHMDLEDVDRIARALGVESRDLLTEED